ncbi:MAG: putative GNAT family N-acyltransferase [Oleiphilaceae bacterium]|jgi:predicted GNAT family N-acyltransferase
MNDYLLKDTILDTQTVIQLRSSVGWDSLSETTLTKALSNSIFFASIWHQDQAVAMGRIVGDGHQYFYLQDMIVNPAHQKMGLCQRLTEHLVSQVKSIAEPGAFFGLMAAANVAGVYQKYGFVERPANMPGMVMPIN